MNKVKKISFGLALFVALAIAYSLFVGTKSLDELKHSVAPTASLYPEAKPVAHVMKMVDDNNNSVQLSDLTDGKWSLLYFGYASCPDTCPMDLAKINQTLHKMKNSNKLQVVFVSVDPSRDIGTMTSFVKGFNSSFIGLSATEDNLVDMSKTLGVYHQVVKAQQLAQEHSSMDSHDGHDADSHDGHDADSHDGHDMESHDGHDMESHDGDSQKAHDSYLIDHTTSYLLLNPELALTGILSSPHEPAKMAAALDEIIATLR